MMSDETFAAIRAQPASPSLRRYLLEMRVSRAGVSLKSTSPPLTELTALIDQPMLPTTLVLKLRECGISLCPCDSDATPESGAGEPKARKLETAAYKQLVELLPRYCISPSKWNRSRGASKVRDKRHLGDAKPFA